MRRRSSAKFWRCAELRRWAPVGACAVIALLLAQCSSSHIDSQYGVSASPRVIDPGEPIPKGGGTYRVGSPYFVGGRMYVPQYDPHYTAVGLASWYGEDFHGRYTANGEVFDLGGISAAHPTMPLPSYARVTNLANGHSIIVRVNDRGHPRITELSTFRCEQPNCWIFTAAAPPRFGSNMSALRRCRARTIICWKRRYATTGPRPYRAWFASPADPCFRRRRHRRRRAAFWRAFRRILRSRSPPKPRNRATPRARIVAQCLSPIRRTWMAPRSISTAADFIERARAVRTPCS